MSGNDNSFVDYKKRRLVFLCLLPVLFIAFIFAFQSMAPIKAADSGVSFRSLYSGADISAGTLVTHDDIFSISFFDENNNPLLDENGNAIVVKSDQNDSLTIPSIYGVTTWKVTSGYESNVVVISVRVADGYSLVKYINDDGTLLKKQYFVTGQTTAADVSAAAPTASKANDSQNTYTFNSWSPAFVDVTASTTYTAQYDKKINQYTVTFVDENGKNIVDKDGKAFPVAKYDYGTAAANVAKPDDPVKAEDDKYTYEFAGWSPAIGDVTADATYTATFKATEKITEATTESTTQATTESTTQASTEAATEAATQAATEATTQATTEAPKEAKVEKPTEAATEAPKTNVNKPKNTKSPGTGDSTLFLGIVAAFAISFVGIILILARKSKLNKDK